MVIEHLQADPVGNDGGLTDGDIGKRTSMNHARLVFGGAHEGRIDGVAHPGGHGISHFQVACRHGIATLVKSHGDVVQALFKISQVSDNGESSHQF